MLPTPIKLALAIFFIIASGLLTAASITDLWHLYSNPNDFEFGSEVYGLKYATQQNFIAFTIGELIITAIVFLISLFTIKSCLKKKNN